MSQRLSISWGRGAAAALLLFALSLFLAFAARPLVGRLDAPTSTAVYDRTGRLLRLGIAADGRYRIEQPLSSYPPLFVEALLLKEDRWFYLHPGVNPFALARAAWHSLVLRDYRAGASTITMQLARLTAGYDTRSAAGKLVQIKDALLMEVVFGKRRILEAYLSRAPCGGNIEGFQAASLAYFGKGLSNLSLSETLLLVSLPQRPGDADSAEKGGELLASRDRLYRAWVRRHPGARSLSGEFDLPVELRPRFPFEAPHAVDRLLAAVSGPASQGRGSVGAAARIDSTIDLDLQRLAERVLRSYVERRASEGIRNAAALLVDTRTMDVLAQVGSAKFFDDGISGQVDGTEARRSPGSALKPFLYALAMEEGVIHPLTVLKDAPIHFSGYNPDNFDNDFEGPIRARDALIRSRNVPAVALMQRTAQPDLYDLLGRAGVGDLKPKGWYGVSLILGTAEVTMKELASLYAMLARSGRFSPLRETLQSPKSSGDVLLSPEAAWLTLDILVDKARPEGSEAILAEGAHPSCAWKTGTSIGFRDAWAVGVSGPYVVAVWVGNFDGTSNPAFVGLSAAGPLLFELFDAFAEGALDFSEAPWRRRPASLVPVSVCAVSGKIPTDLCGRTETTWFIPGKSPIDRCDVHQEIFIDRLSGLRRRFAEEGLTKRVVMEVWPSDIAAVFAKAGLPRRLPPPFAENEAGPASAEASARPQILSPLAKSEFVIRAGDAASDLPLICVVPSDVEKVFWFLDDTFLGSAPRGEALFWTPRPGTFTLRVADDRGRSASSRFTVVLGT